MFTAGVTGQSLNFSLTEVEFFAFPFTSSVLQADAARKGDLYFPLPSDKVERWRYKSGLITSAASVFLLKVQ